VRVLFWVIRALAVLLLIRLVVNALMGGRRRSSAAPRPSGSPQERSLGELVRDPNCGTYVAKAGAITAGSGDNARYYCSVKCRDEHERQ
jgi:hypothetical protein